MSESPRLVTLGSIDGGSVEIQVDVTELGSAVPIAVTLSTDYELTARPPGFPERPFKTGVDAIDLADFPLTLLAGATVSLLACEAAALVAAGAATLA